MTELTQNTQAILDSDDDEVDRVIEKNRPRKRKRLTSDIWEHFSMVNNQSAKCKYCKAVFQTVPGSTSNYWKHLSSKHHSSLPNQVKCTYKK